MQIRLCTFSVVGALLTVLAVLALSVTPAFGQAVAIEEGDDVEYDAVCQNILGSIGGIDAGNDATATSTADADAAASADSEANATAESVAEIAQETGVSIEQVNECLNGADLGDSDRETENVEERGDVDDPRAVLSKTTPDVKALVNTGGIPLLGIALASLAVSVVAISVFSGGSRR